MPKRIRDTMGSPADEALYVAPGTDGCLVLYAPSAFERLAQRLAAASPTQHDVRAFRRLFFSQAERIELDRQGRFRLPQRLAEIAGVGHEAVLLGVEDHWELWEPQRWQKYLAEKATHYDEIAEAAFRPQA